MSILLLLPQWVTALLLPLAVLGFAGWNTPTGLRAGITVCVFLTMFAFFGMPINQYWGSLIAPLLCLGAAQAVRRGQSDPPRSALTAQVTSPPARTL